MSLESDVKQAFEKHDQDAHTSEASWTGIETKIGRAYRRRLAYNSILGLVVIGAIAAFVTLSSGAKQPKGFIGPPTAPAEEVSPTPSQAQHTTSPSPSTTPVIPAGWHPRVGVAAGFRLAIPADWKGGWFEGTWDFEPKVLPGGAQDGNTFVVTVTLQEGNFDAVGGPFVGEEINGHHAAMLQTGTMETDYSIEWNNFCPGYASACPAHALMVRVRASTQAMWAKYEQMGRQVVTSIVDYDGSEPVHGYLSPSTERNAFSNALVRFMDARVEGVGAEDFMCCSIAQAFAANGGLYETAGRPIASWSLVGTGTEAAARTATGAWNYTVQWGNSNMEGEQAKITIDFQDASNASLPPVAKEIGPISHWIA